MTDSNVAEPVRRAGLGGRLLARGAALAARAGVGTAMVKGAVWSIGGSAAGVAASFLTQLILARALEATRYGIYSYLVGWVNVAVLVGKLEFDNVAVRFVGTYDGQRQDSLLHGLLQYGRRIVSRTATGVAFVAALLALLLRHRLASGIGGEEIWAAAVLVPLTALLTFSGSVLQGFRKIPQSQLPTLVLRPVLFGTAIVLVQYSFGMALSAGLALALNAAGTAVALGVSLSFLRHAVPASASAAPATFETARWMHAARGFIVIAAALLILSQQADILVVGTLLGPRNAGLYSIASQLATMVSLGAAAIIFVVLPAVADLHARGRRAELEHLVVRTVQTCAAVSVPVVALLFVAGHAVLHIYGPAFADAYPIMLVLSVAQLVGVTVGLPGNLLPITGHEWEASRVIVGSALLNLALTFVLTPAFGAMGAATATLVAQLIKVGLLRWYAWRYLGLSALLWLPTKPRVPENA
jgi:O-antigen/teichoic acid export membrane protein